MKTLRALLTELEHFLPYEKWGIITPKGKHISGDRHPTAHGHGDLHVEAGLTPKASLSTKDSKMAVEYAQDIENGSLNIRTYSPHSLRMAVDNFAALPHVRTGRVVHPHFGQMGMTEHSGKSYQVLAKMKEMVGA